MITKMKKISFLVLNREYQNFLERLRELGVVHVVERQKGNASDAVLQEDLRLLSRYQTVLKALETVAAEPFAAAVAANLEAGAVADRYEALVSEKESLEQQIQTLLKNRQELSAWGDFEMSSVNRLSKAGYGVRFFCCPPKAFNREWENLYNAIEISSDKQKVYFITVTPAGTEISIDAEPCSLPDISLSQIEAALQENGVRKETLASELRELASQGIPVLRRAVGKCSGTVSFDKVSLSGESVADDTIVLLDGWIPAADEDNVAPALESIPVFFDVSDPTPEDDIPILLDNNRFAKLFEPLTKLYMLPTYQELDLTLIFAPFFMLFFGLCLGDIGYGLLMIVALPIFTKLFQLINPEFSKWLVVLFGASTMLCGLLSGSFFGFSLYDLDIPFVTQMKELLYKENSQMFSISLYIGVVQILLGMAVKAVNLTIQTGFKYALSTIGWLLLLVTVIVAVLAGIEFGNPVIIALLVIACICIFLLNSPGKNPLLNIGLGLWDTYNMATGLLGDVLSYVRLFALGLSGGILANVFNSMATGMSPDIPVVGFIVTALIFLIGHALNIFMNILGAVVHPMRLTFVEFFKNAGYTGGGTEYRPFRSVNE
ncbi:MAG: V-type ATP synthase subunit I [Bacteroidaceae bacterium]|nr:V-type ATP synthase subunit I [Bacteroidaceae bacterium]